jgi:hypothetical protein
MKLLFRAWSMCFLRSKFSCFPVFRVRITNLKYLLTCMLNCWNKNHFLAFFFKPECKRALQWNKEKRLKCMILNQILCLHNNKILNIKNNLNIWKKKIFDMIIWCKYILFYLFELKKNKNKLMIVWNKIELYVWNEIALD